MLDNEAILRKLSLLDIPAALELSCEAGWNQTQEDWRTLIELAPETCMGIEIGGQVVSTATLVCYGKQLAWIGMVLTRSSHRGRGYAKRLLIEILRLADELGIASVKLDATDQGQPLYEKLGFREEQIVERWEGKASSVQQLNETSTLNTNQLHLDTDRAAFGANRSELLETLAKRHHVFSGERGFLLTRPGRTHAYLGPCIAEVRTAARDLMQAALASSPEGDWYWDLLTSNTHAVALARELGFIPKRRLLRMVRGKNIRANEAQIYGLAGFEFG